MFFHLLLTTNCDLRCRYCYVKSCEDIDADFGAFDIDYSIPDRITYNLEHLQKFMKKDPQPVVIFYGGEPMLSNDKIVQIMDNIKVKQFNIQTNGLHLTELGSEHLNRLSTIFVSIDGNEKMTDFYRGKGIYKKTIQNIKTIRKNGFKGQIVARMTLMEETDIYENVGWLLKNPDYSFTSIHWQLDAGFWKNDFHKRPFRKWIEKDYNPKIRELVKFWVYAMEAEGKVLRLYPLLGVMQSLLKEEKSILRCGSGWKNYSIQTDGHIIPCPAMNGMKDYYLGHIQESHPLQLKKVFVGQPCISCEILWQCGGRCLYTNITKRWNNEAYSLVCKTVKNLVESLESCLPCVKRLIDKEKIGLSDFDHLKYNSCEIIP